MEIWITQRVKEDLEASIADVELRLSAATALCEAHETELDHLGAQLVEAQDTYKHCTSLGGSTVRATTSPPAIMLCGRTLKDCRRFCWKKQRRQKHLSAT